MIAEPLATSKIWTYDEVRAIDDDVQRELHDGEIWIMPSPTLDHQDMLFNLATMLRIWAKQQGGKAYMSPLDLYVTETTYYIPDLVFYTHEQMKNGEVKRNPKRLTVIPTLVVEVLSPKTARNDRTLKTRAYAKYGVAHYWILDPIAQTLEAFELRDGSYFLAADIGVDETYAPEAFPGLQIEGRELFLDEAYPAN